MNYLKDWLWQILYEKEYKMYTQELIFAYISYFVLYSFR